MAIIPDLKAQNAALQAQLAQMKAELDAAKAAKVRKLSLKLSEKGCLCVYGLGRYPVSLYASQWESLLNFIPEVRKYLDANREKMPQHNE